MDKDLKERDTNKGKGRIKAADKTQSFRDISEIDKQEGNMEHGTTGGNFDKEEEKKEEK